MLTVVDHLPLAPSVTGPRSNPLAACGLPDAQGLLDLSLYEVQAIAADSHRLLQATKWQSLQSQCNQTPHPTDLVPPGLRDSIAASGSKFRAIDEKLAVRHHRQSRFLHSIVRLRTELKSQSDFLTALECQLGELLTEENTTRLSQALFAIATEFRSGLDRLTACLDSIRRDSTKLNVQSHAHTTPLTSDRPYLRDQLARVLARWWQTSIETPGPTTIALIDADRILLDCPELDRSVALHLLSGAASLITTDRRAGRATLALETPVISSHGSERIIAWSCALIEDAHGAVQSILAAGLDRTKQHAAKSQIPKAANPNQQLISIPADSTPPSERRRKQRLPFPQVQLVAPATGTGLPPLSAFTEQLCHDISEDGFSFLASSMPTSPSIVVALGTCQPHIYMTARVAHFTRCDGAAGVNYIVGCQFIGRTMLMSQLP